MVGRLGLIDPGSVPHLNHQLSQPPLKIVVLNASSSDRLDRAVE